MDLSRGRVARLPGVGVLQRGGAAGLGAIGVARLLPRVAAPPRGTPALPRCVLRHVAHAGTARARRAAPRRTQRRRTLRACGPGPAGDDDPARPRSHLAVPTPLAGIRVLDLTWALAGPYATLQLALLGADVIKVESASAPETTRRGAYAKSPDPESSPTFNSLNLNKRGLRLNLKHPDGLAAALALVRISDIIVENFRAGVLERMGLGYARLRQENPTIIVMSASSFGARGPQSAYPGYASVFNALSGLGNLSGYTDGPPVELRDSIDLRVGTAMVSACLAALFHRRRTGEGQAIDLAAVEAIAVLAGHRVPAFQLSGEEPHRQGNRDQAMAPHGIYRCIGKDAWVSIAVAGDGEFAALCRAIGQPSLAHDPRFAGVAGRLQHAAALDGIAGAWTRERTPAEAMHTLQAAGVAAVQVFSNKELFEDPHLRERGVWHAVEHPHLGQQWVQGLAWRATGVPDAPVRPSPLLGQHTGEVLQGLLGFSQEQAVQMQQAGALH
ncbi:MAG: CoA transferase [Dehalococcoidia bacterium]|nr:CoA transferase [Dehalococcoidia bacterium]